LRARESLAAVPVIVSFEVAICFSFRLWFDIGPEPAGLLGDRSSLNSNDLPAGSGREMAWRAV
jgi:hypothetical protein